MIDTARSTLVRYGVALAALALATAARFALDPALGNHLPYVTYFVAIMAVARYGGLGPSLSSLAIGSLVTTYFFVPPRGGLVPHGLPNLVGLGLYFFVGLSSVLLCEALRAARATAEAHAVEAADKEERLRVTLASIGDAVIATDSHGRVAFMNPVAEALTGWRAAEASGRPLEEVFVIVHEETRRPVESPVVRVLREGTVVGLANHTALIARDGSERPIADSAAPIRDEAGRVTGGVLVFRDVTEKARAEKQLRGRAEELAVANSQLEAVFGSVSEGIVVFDLIGQVVLCNEAEARICGYPTAAEMMRDLAHFAEVFELSDAEGHAIPVDRWPVSRVLRGEAVADWEAHGRRRDTGREWEFSFGGHPVTDADGRQVLAVIVTRDITDRKRAEREVQEAARKMRSVVDHVLDAIITIDERGTIESFNPAAERLFGYERPEVVGLNVRMLMPEPYHGQHDGYIANYLATGQAKVIGIGREVVGRRKDGSTFPMELAVGEFHLGGRRYFTGIVRDITERKQAERELRQRAEQLAEADRRKDEFLAMLGHELRNPLAPVRNALQLLKMPGLTEEEAREERAMIERQIEHLVRLVDDLLDVSRFMRGKIELARRVVDLAGVVARAVETAQPVLDAQGHGLTVSLPPEPLRLEAEPIRLSQVIGNLLTNAAKYTERSGRIWLEAVREGGEVVLRVRDTGMGMPADLVPQVFDLFVQGERSLARSQGGLGIGLTLVRRLVELHGGSVSASSAGPGRGSEFTIRLPALAAAHREGVPSTGHQGGQTPDSPRRVLVVDDNEDAAQSLARLLTRWGHEVQTTYDGPSALEVALSQRPEVVLLDIGMPGMDGYEVARRLRAQREFEAIPLAAITGYGQEDDRRRSRQAGFDHHFTKPVDPGELRGFITSSRRR